MRAVLTAVGLALAAAALVACAGGGPDVGTPVGSPSPSGPPLALSPTRAELPMRVGVTLPLFAEFVQQIGGANVEVYSLVPPGADPHTYQPPESEIARIADTDIFFVNGLGLDAALRDLIEENRSEEAKVVPFAPNIRSPRGPELGDPDMTAEAAGDNPHLWLDPFLTTTYADIVADTFIIYDGVNTDFYTANLSSYDGGLFQLHEEIFAQLRALPPERRRLVTFHDSFVHFARRYLLEVAGFLVETPGQRATPERLTELTAVFQGGVPAAFAEVGLDAAELAEVATQAGVPLCALYTDVPDGEASTYAEMMRFNAGELLRCLSAPPPG